MKVNFIFLFFYCIYFFAITKSIFSQTEHLDTRFNCNTDNICQIGFRKDYKEFIDLKYNHKRKLIYHLDNSGYYYFTYNPKQGKELDFDLKIRVEFFPTRSGNKIIEVGIDTETGSGQIFVKQDKADKKVWKYLFSETPTLSPIVFGDQVLVATDNSLEGGKLFSIHADTGKLNWFFLTPGAILSYPILFESFIIILDDSGNIYWLDKEKGSLKYKFTMEEFPVPNPILREKTLYLCGKRGYMYAIHLLDSRLVWKDLSLMGEVRKMDFTSKGILLMGFDSSWIFDYKNGAKQNQLDRH